MVRFHKPKNRGRRITKTIFQIHHTVIHWLFYIYTNNCTHLEVLEPNEASSLQADIGVGFIRIDLGTMGTVMCGEGWTTVVSLRVSSTFSDGGLSWDWGKTDFVSVLSIRTCRNCAVRGSLLERDKMGTDGIKTGEKSPDDVGTSQSSALGEAGDSVILESCTVAGRGSSSIT